MSKTLKISAVGDLEVRMERMFDAPRPLVWDAWTRPELLQQWLGVRGGWTMAVCEVDLRVGGAYRYVWRKGAQDMRMGGVFQEIDPPARLVSSERFDEAWYDGGCVNTLELHESDGRTRCVVTGRYDSTEARDQVLASPMEQGLEEGYRMLDRLLTVLA